ncbi:MAG: TIGR02450 family Trp-rich protein [Myxococcales bacterium]|nr:TIGR02450 family Trp-rich protein [Myxococcales bacterium]
MTKKTRGPNQKWTAVAPKDKEKHFLLVDVTHQRSDQPRVVLEAILTRRRMEILLSELQDPAHWIQGWK